MAVEHVKGTSVTNADALIAGTATEMNKKALTGGIVKVSVDTCEVSDNADIGSTYRLGRIPSNACVLMLGVKCDTLTGGAADIGLYRTAADGGAVVEVDTYASAQSIATAITTASTNHAFEARDIANIRRLAWQDAGLTSDPGVLYDVVLTLTAQVTDPGTLSMIVLYTDGN